MSLIGDVLKDLDERERRSAGGGCLERQRRDRGALSSNRPVARTASPSGFPLACWSVAMAVVVSGSAAHHRPDLNVGLPLAQASSISSDRAQTRPASAPGPATVEERAATPSAREAAEGAAMSTTSSASGHHDDHLAFEAPEDEAPEDETPEDEEPSLRVLLPRYIEPRVAEAPSPEAAFSPAEVALSASVPAEVVLAASVPVEAALAEDRADPAAGSVDAARSREGVSEPTEAAAKAVSTLVAPPASGSSSIEITQRLPPVADGMSGEYLAAVAAYRRGELAEAERTLKELLERDDALHEARLLLVRLYLEQSRTEQARRVLHAALLRYPRHAASASLYAQVLAGLGRDHEAIDVLQAAMPGVRDDAAFHALLALLYQRTGLVRESVRSYRLALRLDPSRGDWWVGLGIVGEQSGDERLAEHAYRAALQHPLDSALENYVNLRLDRGAVRGAAMTPSREKNGSGSW